jgi:hypothetical protein
VLHAGGTRILNVRHCPWSPSFLRSLNETGSIGPPIYDSK